MRVEGLVVGVEPPNRVWLQDAAGTERVRLDPGQPLPATGWNVLVEGKTRAMQIRYPDFPSNTTRLNALQSDAGEFSLARVRGFIHPPRSGGYQFWLAADDSCELRISSDADAKNARSMVTVSNWTARNDWDAAERSIVVPMDVGKKYFVEVLHLAGPGDNYFSVAWSGPALERAVIEGKFLSPLSPEGKGFINCEAWEGMPDVRALKHIREVNELLEGTGVEELPSIAKAKCTLLGEVPRPTPRQLSPGQPFLPEEHYCWAEVEGEVTFSGEEGGVIFLDLVKSGSLMKLYINVAGHSTVPLVGLLGARVRARGFCHPVLDSDQKVVAGILQTPDTSEIELLDPLAGSWPRLLSLSLTQLSQVQSATLNGQRIRARGVVTAIIDEKTLEISDGDNSTFAGSVSEDGTNWTSVGETTLHMGRAAYMGMAVTSHKSDALNTVRFSSAAGLKQELQSVDIGDPLLKGSAEKEGDQWVIKGSGSDIWDDVQQFQYAQCRFEGECDITVRVDSVETTDAWAKAGILVRESLEPNSKYAFIAVTPKTGAVFQFRLNDRGASGPSAWSPAKSPAWVRLKRSASGRRLLIKRVFNGTTFAKGDVINVVGILNWADPIPTLSQAFCGKVGKNNLPDYELKSDLGLAADRNVVSGIGNILRLSSRELSTRPAVKIRGTITFLEGNAFTLQDDTGGIFITQSPFSRAARMGDFVEIEGQCQPGQFSPVIAVYDLKVIGRGKLPKAAPTSPRQLLASRLDAQWIEMHGTVMARKENTIELMVEGTQITVTIFGQPNPQEIERLVGTTVWVRGVSMATFADNRQLFGMRVQVPSLRFISIESVPQKEPFNAPVQEIQSLTQFNAQGELARHAKVAGRVTFSSGNVAFLQDATGGLGLSLREKTDLPPGTVVEAVGFLEGESFSPRLGSALIRVTGSAPLPEPARLKQSELPGPQHDAKRIVIEAELLDRMETGPSGAILRLKNGGRLFEAIFPKADATLLGLQPSSRLKLTGVVRCFRSGQTLSWDNSLETPPFELLVSSSVEMSVLAAPSAWTPKRIAWIAEILGAIVLLVGAWTAMFYRKNILLRGAQRDLHAARDELEVRVQLRTRELADTNRELRNEIIERRRAEEEIEQVQHELLDASRKAGMAEIAISVLHSVGNALNSINVSVSLIGEALHNSKLAGLVKFAALLQEHAENWSDFAANDSRGIQVPRLVGKLAGYYSTERSKLSNEMEALRTGVEQVKGIVSTQQNYASAGAFKEEINPREIIENAIRWNSRAMERARIQLMQELDVVPAIIGEKHKILQILVNLLQNAKSACELSDRAEKRIEVRMSVDSQRMLQISVRDNGIGIAPETLPQIFTQGFTTWGKKHSFGLHNCALAAKEMGGKLSVASQGVGLGTEMILKVPVKMAPVSVTEKGQTRMREIM